MLQACIAAPLFVLVTASAWAGQMKAEPSHCGAAETVVFSCRIKGTRKVASICSSSAVTAPGGYIQYRFGRLNAPEIRFPVRTDRWEKEFHATHYFRYQVDRRELSFSNQGFRYTIFSSNEGEENPPLRRAGIVVDKDSDTEGRLLHCQEPFVDNLAVLDAVIVPDDGL